MAFRMYVLNSGKRNFLNGVLISMVVQTGSPNIIMPINANILLIATPLEIIVFSLILSTYISMTIFYFILWDRHLVLLRSFTFGAQNSFHQFLLFSTELDDTT